MLASWSRVNRKAKMLLELLGFRSAAALPTHLHSAILRVLMLSPVGPFSTRPGANGNWPSHLPPLRSESCAVQCLFAAWLIKTSKWLKIPRFRYVILLAVTRSVGCVQQPLHSNGISRPAAADADDISQTPEGPAASEPLQQKQQQHHHPLQLLLVAFKISMPNSEVEHPQTPDFHTLQRAEPSEAFTIDNTHRAICRRVSCGKEDQLVLIVEGLGGRLFVLGEPSFPAASPSGVTSGQTADGRTRLEELASLINATAPFCAPPKPSRWQGLLHLFAATATSEGLGTPTTLEAFAPWDISLEDEQSASKAASKRGPQAALGNSVADFPGANGGAVPTVCEELQRRSWLAFLIRCSLAACYAVCRPLTMAMRLPSLLVLMPPGDTRGRDATSSRRVGGCIECSLSRNKEGDFPCSGKGCSNGCSWIAHRRGNGHICSRQQRTLRQFIDDQQRAVAAFAVRERGRKVALLHQEHQMLYQQASRALMDEHGQLFPQARRWVDSTDGQLLMLCLTGRKWMPSATLRS